MLSTRFIASMTPLLLLFTGAHAEDCGALTQMKLGHVAITSAQMVAAGSASAPAGGEEIPAAKDRLLPCSGNIQAQRRF